MGTRKVSSCKYEKQKAIVMNFNLVYNTLGHSRKDCQTRGFSLAKSTGQSLILNCMQL